MDTISSDRVLAILVYKLDCQYLTKDQQEKLKQAILEYASTSAEASPVWGDLAMMFGQTSFDESMRRLVLGGALNDRLGTLSVSTFLDITGERLLLGFPEQLRGEIMAVAESFKHPHAHA